ncbi:hypothetical protein ACLOJK_036385, partial [Asimina triloba]
RGVYVGYGNKALGHLGRIWQQGRSEFCGVGGVGSVRWQQGEQVAGVYPVGERGVRTVDGFISGSKVLG